MSANSVYPISYAIQKKDTYIVKTLVEAGAEITDDDMIDAIKSKNSEIKSLVLKNYKTEE